MDGFSKPMPQFCRQIGEMTLLVGLATIRFGDAPFSSHEVHVDDDHLEWSEKTVMHTQPKRAGRCWFSLVPLL
jgi:hypothetical protein